MLSEKPCNGPSKWVDPFLGNDAADLPKPFGVAESWWCAKPPVGNTHPGATLPFGMVSACAYSGAYVTGYGRYGLSLSGDSPPVMFDRHEALGIAHFQQSGTGRIRMYYNYLLTTPLVGNELSGLGTRYGLVDEQAWPGYYAGRFEETDIEFKVTTGRRAVWHHYKFPPGKTGKVAINIASGGLLIEGMKTYPQSASIEILRDNSASGTVLMEGVEISFQIESGSNIKPLRIWQEDEILDDDSDYILDRYTRSREGDFGILLEAVAPGEPIEVKIGFSLISREKAKHGLTSLADTFANTVTDAATTWDKVLSKVEVEGLEAPQREIFYSSLYHATLKPAEFFDENPFTKKPGPFFFDLSTLWDLYKTQLPLVMSLWPEWGRDFVNFLVEVASREGSFPISYLMDNVPERFDKQATGLCHIILADAQNRGIEADWDRVLSLLWKTSRSGKNRGGRFAEYAKKGVVEPLSHTLDLAFANFCIARMARRSGDQPIFDKSSPLAFHWENAFDKETGLLKKDSTYYEGENWNYSFRFLHDMVGRIKLAGGEENFVDLLDQFFGFKEPPEGETVFRFEGLNNEPDMESPYAYLYAGRHDRTAEVVRSVMRYQFTTGVGGLPGNDDSGGLSSWYVWNAIGLFPAAGLPYMLIGSPIVEKATMKLPSGIFTVVAENQAQDNIYVQKAYLNGAPLNRCFLRLSEFHGEAELRLVMGPEPSEWAKDTRPPSYIS